jgi:hypothetical protein
MKWYYAVGDKPVGPVDRAELESLYEAGTITTATLITQEGMYDWVPYVNLKKTTQFLPAAEDRTKLPKDEIESPPNIPETPPRTGPS